jgi:hypothetical protein
LYKIGERPATDSDTVQFENRILEVRDVKALFTSNVTLGSSVPRECKTVQRSEEMNRLLYQSEWYVGPFSGMSSGSAEFGRDSSASCNFPFEHGGTVYYGCAGLNHKEYRGLGWCPTANTSLNGQYPKDGSSGDGASHREWGLCTEGCPGKN